MSPIRCVFATILAMVLTAEIEPAGRAFADDDVAPLTLVDESAAVCLEIPHFEATWTKFQSSRLAARLKEFPQVERVLSGAGFQKWTFFEEYVRRSTGKSFSEHLLGVFSESVVVAIYLPDGKPPEGVLIAQARDVAALKQVLQAWAALEPQQQLQTKDHRGQSYIRRAKSTNSAEIVYYTTFGRTIALSDQERLIHQIIELHAVNQISAPANAGTPRMLRELPLYQTNKAGLPAEAAALLFINTHKWDKVVDEALRQSPDATWIQPVIRHISAISASLRLDDEVVLDLAADTSSTNLPAAWRQFVGGTQGGGSWEQRIPVDAIMAISSRMEVTPLVQAWLKSTPEAQSVEFARGRAVLQSVLLGRDLFTDVLPGVLRDWTIAMTPATQATSEVSPVDLIGQFSFQDLAAAANEQQTLQASVDNSLQFGMTLVGAILSHQSESSGTAPILVETETTQLGIVRSLGGLKSWKPAFVVTPKFLKVATSRQGLVADQTSDGESSAEHVTRLVACERRYFPSTTQLAWLDAVGLRTMLARRSDWIASQVAPSSTEDRQRVQKHLSKIEEVAKVFDAAFLAASLNEARVHIVVGATLDRIE